MKLEKREIRASVDITTTRETTLRKKYNLKLELEFFDLCQLPITPGTMKTSRKVVVGLCCFLIVTEVFTVLASFYKKEDFEEGLVFK